MNVKRFFGRTNKDALARLRAELGPDAIILKNRTVEGGIEILAMADDEHAVAEGPDGGPDHAGAAMPRRARVLADDRPVLEVPPAAPVPEMTTVSFQQYVRDRLARKSAAPVVKGSVPERKAAPEPAKSASASVSVSVSATQSSTAAVPVHRPSAPMPMAAALAGQHTPLVPDAQTTQRFESDAFEFAPVPVLAGRTGAAKPRSNAGFASVSAASATSATSAASGASGASPEAIAHALGDARTAITEAVQSSVLAELQQMKNFIADQLETLSWYEGTRRQPVRSRLLRALMTAGFSPALGRALVNRVPEEFDDAQALAWTGKALARNLQCDLEGSVIDGGGIFALIGPTGVGKTTSTAKIAARFALKHGTQSVGLVTVDAYRIGGQDQLRSFGRMLGVPVHVAHDAASLADFLHLYMNKKLVLIDTAGIGQRDERVEELLASLSSNVVRKLLVVNAAAQVETQEEVIVAYRGAQAAGMIISKLDEAVRPAGALDCAIRHRMRVVGVADGQRVPEDWSWADPDALITRALNVQAAPAFELDDQLLGMMFSGNRAAPAMASSRSSNV